MKAKGKHDKKCNNQCCPGGCIGKKRCKGCQGYATIWHYFGDVTCSECGGRGFKK